MTKHNSTDYVAPDNYTDCSTKNGMLNQDIETIVGRLVLLLGQTDRLLQHGLRVHSSLNEEEILKIFRKENGITFGKWIGQLESYVEKKKLDASWASKAIQMLKSLTEIRNKVIHDSLLLDIKSNQFVWLANIGLDKKQQKIREHEIFDRGQIEEAIKAFLKFKRFILERKS